MCRKLVTDLFKQWFTVKEKQRHNPDEVDDEELSQMATARDCLKQLFSDRLGCDSAETFMSTATSASDPKVLKQLMTWTTDIHRTFVEDGETSVHFTAATPEELTELYHPFTRECPNASFQGQPLRFTPWPLVKIVRYDISNRYSYKGQIANLLTVSHSARRYSNRMSWSPMCLADQTSTTFALTMLLATCNNAT
jgi:hypothetical protein